MIEGSGRGAQEAGATATSRPPRSLRRWPILGLVASVIVLFWLVLAVIGPAIAPYDVGAVVDFDVLGPMSAQYPLGTDYLGRDILSRILFGARFTVGIALVATSLAALSGLTLGLAAAVIGGWFDDVLSRSLDALVSIPSKMFGLVVVAALGPSIPVLVATMAVIYLPGCYRIVRSLSVNIAALDYVQVARARGEGTLYIMRHEVLPNMIGPVLADFGLRFVYVVLLLSSLSFLGLGVQPPFADWGSLVRENISGLPYGAPAVIMPALAIATLTVSVNLVIDNLPRRRAREGR